MHSYIVCIVLAISSCSASSPKSILLFFDEGYIAPDPMLTNFRYFPDKPNPLIGSPRLMNVSVDAIKATAQLIKNEYTAFWNGAQVEYHYEEGYGTSWSAINEFMTALDIPPKTATLVMGIYLNVEEPCKYRDELAKNGTQQLPEFVARVNNTIKKFQAHTSEPVTFDNIYDLLMEVAILIDLREEVRVQADIDAAASAITDFYKYKMGLLPNQDPELQKYRIGFIGEYVDTTILAMKDDENRTFKAHATRFETLNAILMHFGVKEMRHMSTNGFVVAIEIHDDGFKLLWREKNGEQFKDLTDSATLCGDKQLICDYSKLKNETFSCSPPSTTTTTTTTTTTPPPPTTPTPAPAPTTTTTKEHIPTKRWWKEKVIGDATTQTPSLVFSTIRDSLLFFVMLIVAILVCVLYCLNERKFVKEEKKLGDGGEKDGDKQEEGKKKETV